jgi:predicted Zn-dependent protease
LVNYKSHIKKRRGFEFGKMILPIIVASLNTFASSQVSKDFERLTCSGPVPDDFLQLFDQKYREQLKANKEQNDFRNSSAKKYSAFSTFATELLLKSGKAIYGDTITQYAQGICDYILGKNDLPLNIRVYSVRSEIVNAYSAPQGIIFLTHGLLSRLESEHQLAFIISHEIGHYVKNHSVEKFKEFERLKKDRPKSSDIDDLVLNNLQFSRKTEEQADREGCKLYVNAGYDAQYVYSAFDVLKNSSQLPSFYDHPFNITTAFGIGIPEHLILSEIDSINDTDDEHAAWRSHPTIESRKREIER